MSFFEHLPREGERKKIDIGILDKSKKSIPTSIKEDKIDASSSNIIHIDEHIKMKLKSKMSSLDQMKKTLNQLLWIAGNGLDNVDKLQASTETQIMRRAIQDIEGGFDLTLYLLKTSSIIEEYKEISKEISKNSFVKVKVRDEKKYKRSLDLIDQFFRIAKDYVTIDNIPNRSKNIYCDNCQSIDLRHDADNFICNNCGVQIEMLDDAPTFKDSERVNMSARYTYTCKGHFVEAMNRFEGKQTTEIPEDAINILKTELALHGLGEENRANITKDHIYMFLSEKNFSEYYADINLIYFLVTKKNPPDITKYREELLEMLEQLEEAYAEVKDMNRMNSLNVNWKLYKLLQLLDYPCQKDDFFCLKTPTKQGEHEQKWYEMIEYLKNKYPKAKTSKGKNRWRHIRSI